MTKTVLAKESADLLNLIDTRLVTLFYIHTQLVALNEEYINKSPDLCCDEFYVHNLLKISTDINESIEKMNKSDSQFVSWLRVNILKPLQQYNSLPHSSQFFAPGKDTLESQLDAHLEPVFMRLVRY